MTTHDHRTPIAPDQDWPEALSTLGIPAPSHQFSARIINAAHHTPQYTAAEDWRGLLSLLCLPKPALGFGLAMTLGLMIGWQIGDLSLITPDETAALTTASDSAALDTSQEWQNFTLDSTTLL